MRCDTRYSDTLVRVGLTRSQAAARRDHKLRSAWNVKSSNLDWADVSRHTRTPSTISSDQRSRKRAGLFWSFDRPFKRYEYTPPVGMALVGHWEAQMAC